MQEEFSHTVLHGENFKMRIQNINKVKQTPRLVPSLVNFNNPLAPAPLTPRQGAGYPYDPSRIYKTPIVPRPGVGQLQKSNDKKIPSPAAGGDAKKRSVSAQRESIEVSIVKRIFSSLIKIN